MKIILIPIWLEKLISRGHLSATDLYDYHALRRVLSEEDVATFYAAQKALLSMDAVCETFLVGLGAGTGSAVLSNQTLTGLFNIKRELPLGNLLCDIPPTSGEVFSYRATLIDTDTIGVSVECVLNGQRKLLARQFYSDCLEILYAHQPFEVVSSTSLFREYLQTLS